MPELKVKKYDYFSDTSPINPQKRINMQMHDPTFKISMVLIMGLVMLSWPEETHSQRRNPKSQLPIDSTFFGNLEYRSIGPFRGGRSAAVTGVVGDHSTYYMGATGGGVWKTTDAGASWENISDGYFGGSIGAVEVSTSDPNIVFAGGGEITVRGNVSHGYGIWKSEDAGETWTYKGLREGQFIPRIRVHPKNPDLIYAAVLGHLFGPHAERGIYRSVNGGDTWEKILFVSEDAGGCDLVLDPENPNILYASTWKIRRTPYSLESGGEGSALWKSRDGGNTWVSLNDRPGFPKAPIGIIGVSVSPVNHKRVWAMIEAPEGGLFLSDDAGASWRRVNRDRNLRQRAWYYTRVYADTQDEDMVYVMNVGFHVSTDGGRTFERKRTPHGDHHDLWIAPDDHNIMVVADDGGGQISKDGGDSWSTYHNQPTAQFYRVSTDNHFPYRIYAAQQDNSAIRISHRSPGRSGIGEDDWESTAGGESGHIIADPKDPEIVYGGSYGGYLIRLDHRSNEVRAIDVWPDNPMGWGAGDLKYRFQWNYPILFSRHDANTLLCAANVLFKTTNEGQSWEVISPDLTRNDPSKLGPSGGPITKDNTSVEYYATIFAVAEDQIRPGVIWAGSDDGLVHVTRDGGQTWTNVTPPAALMPEWTMINSIETSPFEEGVVYLAATAYKNDDFTPYILKSKDYGSRWELLTEGIDPEHFTRVVRCDPERKGLLYAGTESGMYISFNDGALWQPFQLNLPIVPITDMTIKENDLIVATQGRSLWIMDDLTPLQEVTPEYTDQKFTVFTTRAAYRILSGRGRSGTGQNPPNGPVFNFYLNQPPEEETLRLDILDAKNRLIRRFRTDVNRSSLGNESILGPLSVQRGLNRISWDMQYPGAKRFENLIMWAGSTSGPTAIPGRYTARLVIGPDSINVPFEIIKNPNASSTGEDYQAQFDFLIECRDKLTETHQAVIDIRNLRDQLNQVKKNLDEEQHKDLLDQIGDIEQSTREIEEALYQTKNQSGQDPLNYPIRLNNKLAAVAGLVSIGESRPTDQAIKVKDELIHKIDIELEKFKTIKDEEIPQLNRAMLDRRIDLIKL
jgi:photosystem II stability/assembly factor-like uncharacterized protein